MKNLNIILATDDKGAVSVLYVGQSISEAKAVVSKAVEKGELFEVKWVRNPSGRTFRPARIAKKKTAKKKAAKKSEAESE